MSKLCGVLRSTVKGEVAKEGRNHVKQETEADPNIGNILHPCFGRPEEAKKKKRHKEAGGEEQ